MGEAGLWPNIKAIKSFWRSQVGEGWGMAKYKGWWGKVGPCPNVKAQSKAFGGVRWGKAGPWPNIKAQSKAFGRGEVQI